MNWDVRRIGVRIASQTGTRPDSVNGCTGKPFTLSGVMGHGLKIGSGVGWFLTERFDYAGGPEPAGHYLVTGGRPPTQGLNTQPFRAM